MPERAWSWVHKDYLERAMLIDYQRPSDIGQHWIQLETAFFSLAREGDDVYIAMGKYGLAEVDLA